MSLKFSPTCQSVKKHKHFQVFWKWTKWFQLGKGMNLYYPFIRCKIFQSDGYKAQTVSRNVFYKNENIYKDEQRAFYNLFDLYCFLAETISTPWGLRMYEIADHQEIQQRQLCFTQMSNAANTFQSTLCSFCFKFCI